MQAPARLPIGLACVVLACARGMPCAADDGDAALAVPAPGDPAAVDLEVELTGGAWLPRAGGDASIGGGVAVQVDADMDLDDMAAAPNLEVLLRRPDAPWWILASGFTFDADTDGTYRGANADFGDVPLRGGAPYAASLEMWSAALEVGTAWWHPYDPRRDGGDVDVRFSPFAGVRLVHVQLDVERPGVARETLEGSWVGLHAGLETRFRWAPPDGLPVGRAFTMEASYAFGLAGGGDGGSYWQVRGGIGLEVTPAVDLMLNYRLLELDVDASDGDGTFDAGLQGLFVALRVRF